MKGKTMLENFFKRRKDLREEKNYGLTVEKKYGLYGLTKDKKYGLTGETIEVDGHILYRIQALKDFGDVKKGDLGGFIEKEGGDFLGAFLGEKEGLWKEGNLCQEGTAGYTVMQKSTARHLSVIMQK
jgi:hypothetical protein